MDYVNFRKKIQKFLKSKQKCNKKLQKVFLRYKNVKNIYF
jgi:hypothetical protein